MAVREVVWAVLVVLSGAAAAFQAEARVDGGGKGESGGSMAAEARVRAAETERRAR